MYSYGAKIFILLLTLGFFATAGFLQVFIERSLGPGTAETEMLYLPSGKILKKISLGHEGILADISWMRAVQYYGNKRLRQESTFHLLAPLIDIAVTLDPQLLDAYRFGCIFLSEKGPVGANNPEAAVALLQKGIQENPGEWLLSRDLGFVYHWYLQDYKAAAASFLKAAENPAAGKWLKPIAADLLAQGGSRQSSRFLWQQIYETSENQTLKDNAMENLIQIAAEEDLEVLNTILIKVEQRTQRKVNSLNDLVALGILKKMPADPKGVPYWLDPQTGKIMLSPDSKVRR